MAGDSPDLRPLLPKPPSPQRVAPPLSDLPGALGPPAFPPHWAQNLPNKIRCSWVHQLHQAEKNPILLGQRLQMVEINLFQDFTRVCVSFMAPEACHCKPDPRKGSLRAGIWADPLPRVQAPHQEKELATRPSVPPLAQRFLQVVPRAHSLGTDHSCALWGKTSCRNRAVSHQSPPQVLAVTFSSLPWFL